MKNTLIHNLGVLQDLFQYIDIQNLLVVADGTALRCLRQCFLNFWPFLDFSTKFPNYTTRWRCYEITELLALRIYLDDNAFLKESLFINIGRELPHCFTILIL